MAPSKLWSHGSPRCLSKRHPQEMCPVDLRKQSPPNPAIVAEQNLANRLLTEKARRTQRHLKQLWSQLRISTPATFRASAREINHAGRILLRGAPAVKTFHQSTEDPTAPCAVKLVASETLKCSATVMRAKSPGTGSAALHGWQTSESLIQAMFLPLAASKHLPKAFALLAH